MIQSQAQAVTLTRPPPTGQPTHLPLSLFLRPFTLGRTMFRQKRRLGRGCLFFLSSNLLPPRLFHSKLMLHSLGVRGEELRLGFCCFLFTLLQLLDPVRAYMRARAHASVCVCVYVCTSSTVLTLAL